MQCVCERLESEGMYACRPCGMHHWREQAAAYYGARYALNASGLDPDAARELPEFSSHFKYIEENFPPEDYNTLSKPSTIVSKPAQSTPALDSTVVARLEMIVDFTTYPDHDDISSVVDDARGYGDVKKATLTIMKPSVKEFV